MQRPDKTQAGNAMQAVNTLTTLQDILFLHRGGGRGGVQVTDETRLLCMQFQNETAGPLLRLKKEEKHRTLAQKNKPASSGWMSNKALRKNRHIVTGSQTAGQLAGGLGTFEGLEHMFTRAVMSRLVQTEPGAGASWCADTALCVKGAGGGWGVELITCRRSQRGRCRRYRGPSAPRFRPQRRSPAGVGHCCAWNTRHVWSFPETD